MDSDGVLGDSELDDDTNIQTDMSMNSGRIEHRQTDASMCE